MPYNRTCLSPHDFLDRISSRLLEDVDTGRIKRCRSWIQNHLAPRLNSRGAGVSGAIRARWMSEGVGQAS